MNVSPLKKSKMGNSFFDGRISDGIATMRFVGYDSKVRRRIGELEGKDVGVKLRQGDRTAMGWSYTFETRPKWPNPKKHLT